MISRRAARPWVASLVAAVALLSTTTRGQQAEYIFTTIAGQHNYGSTDATGRAARFNEPADVAFDGQRNLFVADSGNHTIRKVTPAGVVSTFAGAAGASGSADGAAGIAKFQTPLGVAIDASGYVYVADSGNHTIRRITPAGEVSTLAGAAGAAGSADGIGAAARFNTPSSVAVDATGNIYVADTGNHTIRRISPTGEVATIAGQAGSAGRVDGASGAARFQSPVGIALSDNALVVSEQGALRRISAAGVVSTLTSASGPDAVADPRKAAVDGNGNIYVGDRATSTLRRVRSDGVMSVLAGETGVRGNSDGIVAAAHFWTPGGLALDPDGNLYVADGGNQGGSCRTGNNMIRVVTPDGVVTTFVGRAGGAGSADGPGSAAQFDAPHAVATAPEYLIWVADTGNHTIRAINREGVVTTIGGAAGVRGSRGGNATLTARFDSPAGLCPTYVVDTGNSSIGTISSGTVGGAAGFTQTAGFLDGGMYTAKFDHPSSMVVNSIGLLVIADTNNHAIRAQRGRPSYLVWTLAGLGGVAGSADGNGSAARFNRPTGIVYASDGSYYVTDTGNHTIRKISSTQEVTTLAGLAGSAGSADGTGSAARFNAPEGLTLGGDGNLYVADTGNHTIRRVTPTGEVTTLAGLAGTPGYADGRRTKVRFRSPHGVFATSTELYVVDETNTVRKAISGSFVIVTQPVDESVAAGGTRAFSVRVESNGTPSYEWEVMVPGTNYSTSLDDAGVYSGTRTNTLVVTGATVAMSGNVYRCRVANGISAQAVLTVVAPSAPVIRSQPASVTVSRGGRSSLTVAAGGTYPLRYTWQVQAGAGQEWTTVSDGDRYAGSRSSTLTISSIPRSFGGSRVRCVVSNAVGEAVSDPATVTVLISAIGSSDVDGDGAADVVLRHASTLELGSWTSASGYVRIGSDAGAYSPIAYADFDGDGRVEAAWRHTGSGALVSWTTTGQFLSLGTQAGAWQVFASGDFDGDGRTEFLWRHAVTAEIATWTAAGAYLHLGDERTGWQVIGVADFDGDGKSEPLWRHASTTEVGTWTMAGAYARLGAESGGWDVIGLGDFDGDGKAEPLWRDRGTLEIGSWTIAGSYVRLGNESTGWVVIGVGDYDADGRTEPLWRNLSSKEIGTWKAAGGYLWLASEANGWQVVPQAPRITAEPLASQRLRSGGTTTLTVGVTSNPAPILQWQVSGDGGTWADVVDGTEYSGAGTASLTITNASRSQNGNQYRCVVRNGAGRAISSTATLSVSARACVANDLDGDGKTDILWRYTPLQELGIWNSTGFVHLGTEGTGWVVIGVGDFDADGKMELVWRHTGSGQVATWPSGGGYVPLGTESAWQVIRIGDFDGDGRSELLWRHSGTGQVVTWTQAGAYLELGAESDGWRVIGIADFDGDGRQEPAWRNTNTFEIRTTTMAGATIRLGTEGGGWTVTAFGDADGDRQAEPFWRHAATLENVTWTRAGGFVRLGTESSGGWHVVAVGDYDGDGRSEPLWQHETTREIATWPTGGGYLPLGTESGSWVPSVN